MSVCDLFPRLRLCCFCVDLRKGAIMIAVISLVLSIIALGLTLVLINIDHVNAPDFQESLEILRDWAPWIILINGFGFIFHTFLLLSILRNKRVWFAVCLLISALIIVISFIFNIYLLFTGMEHKFFNREAGVRGAFYNLIQLYFWLCLQSYYQEAIERGGMNSKYSLNDL